VQAATALNQHKISNHYLRNSLLARIIAAETDTVLPRLQIVDTPLNQSIYNEGDQIGFVYFPIDSLISSLATLQDGTSVEVSMTGSEGIVGIAPILASTPNQYWIRTCVAGTIARLDVDAFADVLNRNSRILKAVFRTCDSLIKQISQRSVCNVRHSVMERFCCWLLMVQDRIGTRDIKLTQDFIAGRLGARRAGITVAARELYDRNAIEYKRGSLQIKDRALIENEACECYSVLRLERETAQECLTETSSRNVAYPTFTSQASYAKSRANP